MGDFIIMFVSMLVCFGLGFGAMLMVAGKIPLHYLLVKMSRGRKILLFVDTPFGRKTYVGKIEGDVKEGVVSWDYHTSKKLTEVKGKGDGVDAIETDVEGNVKNVKIKSENIGRFFGVFYMALNSEAPFKPYNLSLLGEIPHSTVDLVTFQNLLDRAQTKPSLDGDQVLKMIRICLVVCVIVALICVALFFKIGSINTTLAGLGVI